MRITLWALYANLVQLSCPVKITRLKLNPARNWVSTDSASSSKEWSGKAAAICCNQIRLCWNGHFCSKCLRRSVLHGARNNWGPPWFQPWNIDWNSEALTWVIMGPSCNMYGAATQSLLTSAITWWILVDPGGSWWFCTGHLWTLINFMLPLAPCFSNAVLATEGEPGATKSSEMSWIYRSKCTASEIAGALVGLCLTCWNNLLK